MPQRRERLATQIESDLLTAVRTLAEREGYDREASEAFEWQGRAWHLRISYWKSQKRYRCPYCRFDHYNPTEVLKHLALGHLHPVYRGGKRFDLVVLYRTGATIYKCFDCTFESQRAGAVADHCGITHRKLLPLAIEPVLESIAEEPGNAPPGSNRRSPPHLSPREIRVHDAVGEGTFKSLTTSEIMQRFKRRLRDDCHLEPGNATRMTLDRIRRGKNYPLSRQIKKKRSMEP